MDLSVNPVKVTQGIHTDPHITDMIVQEMQPATLIIVHGCHVPNRSTGVCSHLGQDLIEVGAVESIEQLLRPVLQIVLDLAVVHQLPVVYGYIEPPGFGIEHIAHNTGCPDL